MKIKNLKVGDIIFPTDQEKIKKENYHLKELKIKSSTHFKIVELWDYYKIMKIQIIPSWRVIKDWYNITYLLKSEWYSMKKKSNWKIEKITIK